MRKQVIFSKKKRSWGVRGILRGLRGVLSQSTPLSPYKMNLKYFSYKMNLKYFSYKMNLKYFLKGIT
ncbi:hypothetical protein L931_09475 [Helicobacter pylori PZ5024]|uniref:Uncharacterized protein n=1 Tax=Helicobacter pylori PZ5024 TaxID=1337391 RepID=T2SYB8_HELPX|nr:hypothetical protein L931_09475 [Helicobacter pylori PZ5024]